MNTSSRISLLALLLTGLTTTGCIQMEHDLQIQTNGAAVYRLDYTITEQAITQFRAILKLRNDLARAANEAPDPDLHPILQTLLDPNAPAIREQALALAAYGISLRNLRESPRAHGRQFSLTLDIENIQRLSEIPFFSQYGFALHQNAEGQYVLERPALVHAPGALPPRFSEHDLSNIRPILAGFRTEIRIQVPGRILSTTAGRTAMQTATWIFDFDRHPEALHELLRQRIHVLFQAPQLNLPAVTIGEDASSG